MRRAFRDGVERLHQEVYKAKYEAIVTVEEPKP